MQDQLPQSGHLEGPVIADESGAAGELSGEVRDILTAWVLPGGASFWGAGPIWLLAVSWLLTLVNMVVSSALSQRKPFLLLHLLVGCLDPGVMGRFAD